MNEQSIDPRLIMQAALDGELDAASQLAFERGLSNNPALAKEYDILITLRHTLEVIYQSAANPAIPCAGPISCEQSGSIWLYTCSKVTCKPVKLSISIQLLNCRIIV